MDLYDAATYHLHLLAVENKSPKTVAAYMHWERTFLVYLESEGLPRSLEALNPVNVRAFSLWMRERSQGKRGGLVAAAQATDAMHRWSRLLWREGVLPYDTLERMKPVRVPQLEVRPFETTELLAMLEAAAQGPMPSRDRAVILLLLRTGLRIKECAELTTDRLRLADQTVRVMGKGGKERSVHFGDSQEHDGGDVVRAMRAWMRDREAILLRHNRRGSPWVWIASDGTRIGIPGLRQMVRRVGDRAGVPDAHPHRFRHTMATAWLTTWHGDEVGLRRVLGQVSTRVMERYIHLSEQTVRSRAAEGSPIRALLGVGADRPHAPTPIRQRLA